MFGREADQGEGIFLPLTASFSPTGRVLLCVHVKHQDIQARERCGSGDAPGQRGLSDALIDRDCNRSHVQLLRFAGVHNSNFAILVKSVSAGSSRPQPGRSVDFAR